MTTTVANTNGTNPVDLAGATVDQARAELARAERAARKAGDRLADAAATYRDARAESATADTAVDAARSALTKAERKLRDAQGAV